MAERFDAIVVGAGTSGSVIVRRLVDAGQRVLLLEAGREDTNPAIHDPARLHELWHAPEDWDYYTVPQAHAANRELHLPRGKVLGGSGALNGMIWVRGSRQDYDGWAAAGCDGWGWEDVLPVYKQIENFDGGESAMHGTDGLLDVISDYPMNPIQQAIIDAAVQIGLERNLDYNDGHLDGVSAEQVNIRDGERLSTYTAYVRPIRGAANLTVMTDAWVHRLMYDDSRVVGLEYERGGERVQAHADEVILAAGALDSPRILLLSGIGSADELRALGIDVRVDLPGVGKNLHDHLLSPVIFSAEREIAPPLPGSSVTQTHLFWRSRPGLAAPDTQPCNFSAPMYAEWMSGPGNGFSLMAGMIAPLSRGELRVASADPHDRVLIDPNILAAEDDARALVASVRQCQQIGAAPALAADWGAKEQYPGLDFDSDEQMAEYVRRTAITYHHQVGTAKMGVDEMSVVEPTSLKVHGIDGLRVADASVMPTITSGNTNAPSALIGEKAASFLL